MGASSWIINIILAVVGLYWIKVEMGLTEKTPLLYLGIVFLLPIAFKIIMKFSSK